MALVLMKVSSGRQNMTCSVTVTRPSFDKKVRLLVPLIQNTGATWDDFSGQFSRILRLLFFALLLLYVT